jgi:hypothetical protein
MKMHSYIFVLFMFLAFGASLAVPAEDLPETAYDESESLPYEMTPALSGDLVQQSVPTLQVVPIVPSDQFSTPKHASGRAGCRELAAHLSDSLIVLDHSFRC